MPVRPLPNDPSLEQLKNHAKTLQHAVRAGVPEAVELVREFHPRHGALDPESAAAARFSRTDAQLVLARRYGFASWPQLRAHLEVVARYSRAPHRDTPPAADAGGAPGDEFLRLACLTHDDDDPARWRHVAEILVTHPELTATSIHAAAAAGDVAATRTLLRADASTARREGGPHRWEPLLYLAYSTVDDRLPGRSHLEVARQLLDAGADPNAGYLWEGLPSPYTALTGALSSGHSQPLALARVLLERGADPNDSQTLYELGLQTAGDDTAALELLFEFGLGTGTGGVWHARLAPAHPTPAQLVEDELLRAAAWNWPRRARLVLEQEVDVSGSGSGHPIFEGRNAYELAVLNGNTDVAALLEGVAAGAQPDPELEVLGACMRADRATIERLRARDPDVVERARARRPHQLSVAADQDRLDAVKLMVDLGFDIDATDRAPHRQTALHGAAFNGNLEMVRFLVEHGADPSIEDCSFHATPLGWAEHNGQAEVVEYLRKLDR